MKMSSNSEDVKIFDDPCEARVHMAALLSDAYLQEARAAMSEDSTSFGENKKAASRKRSSKSVSKRRCKKRAEATTSTSDSTGSQPGTSGLLPVENFQTEDEDFESLDSRLKELRDTLSSLQGPEASETISIWAQRQLSTEVRMKTARPILLDAKLSSERIITPKCHRCKTLTAVIRCLECVAQNTEFLCDSCDVEVHKSNIFHDREALIHGFLEPIPPTTAVMRDEKGQPQFCQQTCLLPLPTPKSICDCSCEPRATLGKHTLVVTINGRYDACLPHISCPSCHAVWTPEVKDLLLYRYWPASTSCQTLFKFDVFTSFEQMKIVAPAMSRQAFIKMLEHRSHEAGRVGSVCADTFQRSFFDFSFCCFQEEEMCHVRHFVCPACSPDTLAVCCDGNRKHYRFRKSKGTDDSPLYQDVFLAKDEDVATFVDLVRGNMKSEKGSTTCGPAKFTAGKEMSQQSSANVDEEGIQVAVCRHGYLLRGLNHYRGEIFAYPMFLQREMSKRANVTFFCMDVTCKYWPYLNKVAERLPELLPLTEMQPFLSVMHAKAHTAKCEVKWGGRSQDGAGNTVGEEVEQVNSFLSRAALVTKYMTKAGRVNMLTQQAMGWNRRKTTHLHQALAHRYAKIMDKARMESASLCNIKEEHSLDEETVQQWVFDVKQWAVTERSYTPGCIEDLRADIENITVALQRKKQDLYRQHDSSKARQRKRKNITEMKKKLHQKVLQYNAMVEGDPIDVEAACSLTGDYILPWERHENGNAFRLKKCVFDQVMLVRRLEEEQSILVKEMSQHLRYLQREIQEVEALKKLTLGSITTGNFCDLTEEATHGLGCVLNRRLHVLKCQQDQAANAYTGVAVMDRDLLQTHLETSVEDDWDNNCSSSQESDEEM